MSKMMDDKSLVPVTGTGTPDFQKNLSDGDQKTIDEKGVLVVEGHPWSSSHTGLYLCVVLTRVNHAVKLGCDRSSTGRSIGLPVGPDGVARALGMFVTRGRPSFNLPIHGLALELPGDLAHDALKIKYVTEWFIDTVKECMQLDGGDPTTLNKVAAEMIMVVEQAIHEAGL